MSTKRSLRSSGRRKKPNPALYVGYVEDDETPEMIMKKFAEMERMISVTKQANKADACTNAAAGKAEMSESDEEERANADTLTEEQLVSLFNDTSYYSINSLQHNNQIMFQKHTVDEEGFVVGIADPDYEQLMFEVDYNPADTDMCDWMNQAEDEYVGEAEFWDDDDGDDNNNNNNNNKSTRRNRSGLRISRNGNKRVRFAGHDIESSNLQRTSSNRKSDKKMIYCHEPCYLKVPAYPIPRSWLKPIEAYDNRTRDDQFKGYHYQELDILSLTNASQFFFANNTDREYKAILMDPPFDLSDSPVHVMHENEVQGTVTLDEFAKLPMGKVVPDTVGCMLFIWVPSELTMQITDICEQWGFSLVEHATWIKRNLSYQIENRESNLFGVSKCNLLLFRRNQKNAKYYVKLELRHQRTSDSYFDFVRYHPETGRELKSNYHYKVIETMLPDLDNQEKGSALFLWAPKNERRDGWTCITDTRYLKALQQNQHVNTDIGDW